MKPVSDHLNVSTEEPEALWSEPATPFEADGYEKLKAAIRTTVVRDRAVGERVRKRWWQP
jgi:hypothetical protein